MAISAGFSLLSHTAQGLGTNGGTTTPIDTRGATLIILSGAYQSYFGTPTDSAGNSWLIAHTLSVAPGGVFTASKVWYRIFPKTSATHTFTATASGGLISLFATAWYGLKSGLYVSRNGSTAAANTSTTTGGVIIKDDMLVYSMVASTNNSDTQHSLTGGFATMTMLGQVAASGANRGGAQGYSIMPVGTTLQNATWGLTNSGAMTALIVSFDSNKGSAEVRRIFV